MSQHNIVGSEAFSNRQYVLITHVRSSGSRRRRARAMTAYVVVAVLALSAGAAAAAFALGPFLVGMPQAETVPVAPASDQATPSLPTPPAD